MEISIKTTTLFSAVLLTGLSAGLFYAWSVSVIPGTKEVSDQVYLSVMQSINRAILNPAFYLVFFGSLILLIISTIQHLNGGPTFWFLLAASLFYLLGTFGVTSLGNVPLNNELDILEIGELSVDLLAKNRHHFESKWNRFHTIRTVFSGLSFLSALVSVFTLLKSI